MRSTMRRRAGAGAADCGASAPARIRAAHRRLDGAGGEGLLRRRSCKPAFRPRTMPTPCSKANFDASSSFSLSFCASVAGGPNSEAPPSFVGTASARCIGRKRWGSSSIARPISSGREIAFRPCAAPIARVPSMSRPILSPMRRAVTSGSWSGCHCQIGTSPSELSRRNVGSWASMCRRHISSAAKTLTRWCNEKRTSCSSRCMDSRDAGSSRAPPSGVRACTGSSTHGEDYVAQR